MAYTLADCQSFYDSAKSGYLKTLEMLNYEHGDKKVERERVDKLRAEMEHWQGMVDKIEGSGQTNSAGDKIIKQSNKIKVRRINPL